MSLNYSDSDSWKDFIKGIDNNPTSTSSVCKLCLESLPNRNAEMSNDVEKSSDVQCKSLRIPKKECRPNLNRIKFKTHRPQGIKHVYDTDTELVLTLSIRHAKKVRPKLHKSCFEHPKRTVFYQPETNFQTEIDKPHLNETITSLNVPRKGFGLLIPVLLISCIFVVGAFVVMFTLLFKS